MLKKKPNEPQTPPFLATDSGRKLTILQRNVGQNVVGLHVDSRRDTIKNPYVR